MRLSCLFPWFLCLLVFGTLPLLFQLVTFTDLIKTPKTGLNLQVVKEMEEELNSLADTNINSLHSSLVGSYKPLMHKLLKDTTDIRAAVEWKENLQQQIKVQELRRSHLANFCSQYYSGLWQQTMSKKHLAFILVEERSRLMFCLVPKVGCTNWKLVLTVLAGKAASVLDLSPYSIHTRNPLGRLNNYSQDDIDQRLNNYTMVMFTREPFQRLVSAYRNKFVNQNKLYHRGCGRRIIAKYRTNATEEALHTGDGVTFREFVRFVLDEQFTSDLDMHWRPVNRMCHPCLLKYDFIGKFENMNREANFLLRSIGAPPNVSLPESRYSKTTNEPKTDFDIMNKYFSQLNATERQGLYDLYLLDYVMFDYPKPFPDLH